jgi:ABC-type Mn2+/Zn2+ transport system ATPase subunit
MAQRKQKPRPFLLVEEGQPLVAVPLEIDGRKLVAYVPQEGAIDDSELPQSVRDALNLAGAWSDLDWEEAQATLARIRRDSKPFALRETADG